MSPFHFLLILSLVANQLLACGHSHQHMMDHHKGHNHEHFQTPHLHLSFSAVHSHTHSQTHLHDHGSAKHAHADAGLMEELAESGVAELAKPNSIDSGTESLILLPVVQVATTDRSEQSGVDQILCADLSLSLLALHTSLLGDTHRIEIHTRRSWFHPGDLAGAPLVRDLPLASTRLQL